MLVIDALIEKKSGEFRDRRTAIVTSSRIQSQRYTAAAVAAAAAAAAGDDDDDDDGDAHDADALTYGFIGLVAGASGRRLRDARRATRHSSRFAADRSRRHACAFVRSGDSRDVDDDDDDDNYREQRRPTRTAAVRRTRRADSRAAAARRSPSRRAAVCRATAVRACSEIVVRAAAAAAAAVVVVVVVVVLSRDVSSRRPAPLARAPTSRSRTGCCWR